MNLCGGQEPWVPPPKEGRTGYEIRERGAEKGEAGEDAEDVEEGDPGAGAYSGFRRGALGRLILLVFFDALIIVLL